MFSTQTNDDFDDERNNPVILDFIDDCEQLLSQMRSKTLPLTAVWSKLLEIQSTLDADSLLPLWVFVDGLHLLIANAPEAYQNVLILYKNQFFKYCRENESQLYYVALCKGIDCKSDDDNTSESEITYKKEIYDNILNAEIDESLSFTLYDQVLNENITLQPIKEEELNAIVESVPVFTTRYSNFGIIFGLLFLTNYISFAAASVFASHEIKDSNADSLASADNQLSAPQRILNQVSPAMLETMISNAQNLETDSHAEIITSLFSNLNFDVAAYKLRKFIKNNPGAISSRRVLVDLLFTNVVDELNDGECEIQLKELIILQEKASLRTAQTLQSKVLYGTILAQRYLDRVPSQFNPAPKRFTPIKSKKITGHLDKAIQYLELGAQGEGTVKDLANDVLLELVSLNLINIPINKAIEVVLKFPAEQRDVVIAQWKNVEKLAQKSISDPIPSLMKSQLNLDMNRLPDDAVAKMMLLNLKKMAPSDTHTMYMVGWVYNDLLQDTKNAQIWFEEAAARGCIIANLKLVQLGMIKSIDDQEKIGAEAAKLHLVAGYYVYAESLYMSGRLERLIDCLEAYIEDEAIQKVKEFKPQIEVTEKFIFRLVEKQFEFSQRIRLNTIKARILYKNDQKMEAYELLRELMDDPLYKKDSLHVLAKSGVKKVLKEIIASDSYIWNSVYKKMQYLVQIEKMREAAQYLSILNAGAEPTDEIQSVRNNILNLGLEIALKETAQFETKKIVYNILIKEKKYIDALNLLEKMIEVYNANAQKVQLNKLTELFDLLPKNNPDLTALAKPVHERMTDLIEKSKASPSAANDFLYMGLYASLIAGAGLLLKRVLFSGSKKKKPASNNQPTQSHNRRNKSRSLSQRSMDTNESRDSSSSVGIGALSKTNKLEAVVTHVDIMSRLTEKNSLANSFKNITESKKRKYAKYITLVQHLEAFKSEDKNISTKRNELISLFKDNVALLEMEEKKFNVTLKKFTKKRLTDGVDANNVAQVARAKENLKFVEGLMEQLNSAKLKLVDMKYPSELLQYKEFKKFIRNIKGGIDAFKEAMAAAKQKNELMTITRQASLNPLHAFATLSGIAGRSEKSLVANSVASMPTTALPISIDKGKQPEAIVRDSHADEIALAMLLKPVTLYKRNDLNFFSSQTNNKEKDKRLSFEEKIARNIKDYLSPIYVRYRDSKFKEEDAISLKALYYYITRLAVYLYENERILNRPDNIKIFSYFRHDIIHHFFGVEEDKVALTEFCRILHQDPSKITAKNIEETSLYQKLIAEYKAHKKDNEFNFANCQKMITENLLFLQNCREKLLAKVSEQSISSLPSNYIAAIKGAMTMMGESYAKLTKWFPWMSLFGDVPMPHQELLGLDAKENQFFHYLYHVVQTRNLIGHNITALIEETRGEIVLHLFNKSTDFNADVVSSFLSKVQLHAHEMALYQSITAEVIDDEFLKLIDEVAEETQTCRAMP